MNRNEMIKWLSENTTREQWVTGFELPKFKTTLKDIPWCVFRSKVSNDPYRYVTHLFPNVNSPVIRIDDVFEPVNKQPVYIDGGIYEIGVMNGEPQQFVYNLKLNMFERGSNESIGASNVHDSKVVTHFKLVQGPSSEHDTVAKEIINNIRRGADMYFNDKPMSDDHGELVGVVNGLKQLLDLPETATLTELFNTVESIELRDKPVREPSSAVKILNDAAECIGDRAAERDTDNERSMLSTVNAFNAMYGTELTETQGWMFMVFLKASRAKQGNFREDDYTDGSSYFALAGECDGNVRR